MKKKQRDVYLCDVCGAEFDRIVAHDPSVVSMVTDSHGQSMDPALCFDICPDCEITVWAWINSKKPNPKG